MVRACSLTNKLIDSPSSPKQPKKLSTRKQIQTDRLRLHRQQASNQGRKGLSQQDFFRDRRQRGRFPLERRNKNGLP